MVLLDWVGLDDRLELKIPVASLPSSEMLRM